jgi:hypothetical protein
MSRGRRKSGRRIPKVGDVFLVPLENGSFAAGHVYENRPILMNSMTAG